GDLDLNRMSPFAGRAEMLGYEPAGKRFVAANPISRSPEARLENVDDGGRRARAKAVAQHDIEPARVRGVRGHRMAVDQHRDPEPPARAFDQGLQFSVIGSVERSEEHTSELQSR